MKEMKKKFKLETLITGVVVLAILVVHCFNAYNFLLLLFIGGFAFILCLLSIFYKWWILFIFTLYIVLGNSLIDVGYIKLENLVVFIIGLIGGCGLYYNFPLVGTGGMAGRDEKYFLDYLVKYWWIVAIAVIVICVFLTTLKDSIYFIMSLYPIPITTYGYAMLRYKKACEKRKKAIWPMVNP